MDNLFLLLFFISIFCFIAGIIQPTIFSKLIKENLTRKKVATIFGIATISFFILFGMSIDDTVTNEMNSTSETEETVIDSMQTDDTKDTENVTNLTQVEEKSAEDKPIVVETEKIVIEEKVEEKSQPTSEPIQEETKEKQEVSPTPSETVSQKNAVRSAKSYLNYSSFSYEGLIAQLEYEQFSHADAVYGVDNSGADWYEQAAKSAEQYMEYSAFSRGSLIEQLKYAKFTQAQAEYGANVVGL